jgi:CPA1 family monovalent cation:H+ antiporter
MSALTLILLLFAVVAALRVVADRTGIPLPTLLVLGGLGIAFTPGLPHLVLDPDTVFLIFIPPLLFWAAIKTSLRDLRRNLRAITLLAGAMVIATMGAVARTTHALLPELPLAVCFVLGAIVSPPDAVAVIASTRRLKLPRDMIVILEGESLVNDATALVAYQIALAAVTSGTFSIPRAGADLLFTGAGGIAVGLAAGWCVGWVRVHMPRTSVVENTISLLSPFIAFIPANALGCSGVLAVVAMGLFFGRKGPRLLAAQTRLQGTAMWEMLTFLLEGLIFIFVGLQLPEVVRALEPGTLSKLIGVSFAVAAAMIATRLVLVFPGAYLPRLFDRGLRSDKRPYPPWRHLLFTGWAGIRGGDSLIIALALPLTVATGSPLPGRNEIIFITFVVILITLVLQGFTLAPLVRLLRIVGGNEEDEEMIQARSASAKAGASALDRSESAGGDPRLVAELRQISILRSARPGSTAPSLARLRLEMIAAEREAVIAMRDRNEIGDPVMRTLLGEFDHEEMVLSRDDGAAQDDEATDSGR